MHRLSSSLLLTAGSICLAMLSADAKAQVQNTEHTLKLAEGAESPAASLDEIAWLAGHRRGTAFGVQCESLWSPRFGSSMTGLFKLADGNDVQLYEILIIKEAGESIELRLKHFDSELAAWESEGIEPVIFRLVKVEENAVYFEGLTYQIREDGTLVAYVALTNSTGEVQEAEVLFDQQLSPTTAAQNAAR